MILTRGELLGLTTRRYRLVHLPDGDVRIRSLTESEKTDFEASILNTKGDYSLSKMKAQRRRLIALCLVDDKHNLLLQPGDEELLKNIDGAIASRLYDECREHCGFEEGDIEDLVKNSASVPANDSPTD